ncbi:DNRLRE domain-containing protein [Peribacillus acanthi]|uniref:DNRLRE domain-containing protein n=1 Tax=Peribacillus acanthi TaxID=2171554 RepID=UPI000D3E096A|nr:DNRLRE domain-containing protein [Peribacillus acanthi]
MKETIKNQGLKGLTLLIILAMMVSILPARQVSIVSAEEKESPISNPIVVDDNKEIISLRTENSKTYLNEDGTHRAEISQEPIHFKDEKNQWQPIDNKIVSNNTEGVYENKANAFTVQFDQQQESSKPLMEIAEDNISAQLTMEPLQHTQEEPAEVGAVVKEESVVYPNIYSDIDIQYTVGSDRIKEDIIYTDKPTDGFPEQFTYKMNLEGLKVKEQAGVLYLYDVETNKPLFYFETPYMYDSYIPNGFVSTEGIKSIPEEAKSYDVELKHEVIDNQLYLHIVPNISWLEDPDRVYPITIDPTIVRLQSTPFVEDTNLRSSFPTQTGGDDWELGGGASSGNVIRSLIKFDLSSIPLDSTILGSSLNLWFSSTNNSSPIDVSLYKMSKDWAENEASWTYAKKLPSFIPWTSQGGDYVTSNKLATVSGLTAPSTLDQDMKNFRISTSIIEDWKNSPSSNYGFLLKSDTEAINIYKKFVASEHTVAAKYKPLLVVTYRTIARLGLEGYWPYDSHPLVGGTSYSNLTTLNNIIQYDDSYVLGHGGFDFQFTRTYNSKSLESSALGLGWTFTGNEKLYLNIKGTANVLNYQDEDGTDHEFTYDGPTATYYSGPGKYLTIKKTSSDTYTMTDKYGIKSVFKIRSINPDTDVQVANIDSQIDLHNNKINYEYNATQLTRINTDLSKGLGKSIEFAYYSNGLIKTITFEGSEFTYKYDGTKLSTVEELKEEDDTTGERTITITSFHYNDDDLLSQIEDPNKRKTDYTYKNGYLEKVQEPQEFNGIQVPPDRPGTTYNLNTELKQSVVTDPVENKTTYTTNENYVVIKIVEPNGSTTSYTLDANYNIKTVNEDGKITTNDFDSNGNLLHTEDPENKTQTFTYTTYSNIKTHTDSTGKIITYNYLANGDLDTIEEIPDVSTPTKKLITNYDYDVYGEINKITYPDGTNESITIDYANGNKSITYKSQKNDGVFIENKIVTDLKGNVLNTIDGKSNEYSYVNNKKNEMEEVTDPIIEEKDQKIKYAYDSNGNITDIISTDNEAINVQLSSYDFNGQNLLKIEENAIGNIINYSYYPNGNLKEILLPNTHKIFTDYDNMNRISHVYLDEGTGKTLKWEYIYDKTQLKSIKRGTAPYKTFEYYNNDLLKLVTEGVHKMEYSYSGVEYNSEVKYQIGTNPSVKINYVPDGLYRTKEVKRNDQILATTTYHDNGHPNKITYSNGIMMDIGYINGMVDTYKIHNQSNQSNQLYYNASYKYDKNKNIQTITTDSGTTDYTYDELNQLKSESLPDGTVISYDYHTIGNRKSKSITKNGNTSIVNYTFNNANQLETVGNIPYFYDKNGNLQSDGTRTFKFNDFNQLEQVSSNQEVIATYTYDEEGKRKSSTTAKGTTYYFYDGDKVLYETDENNQVIKEYTYDDFGYPLTMTIGSQNYYYLNNHHGDVLGLTDENGNIVASYTYDAWGNILTQTGLMASENPYRYAGYRYDENTKLYYLLARYYNPDNGVFLSIDPVRGNLDNPLTQNGYSYVLNNPVMLEDPEGTTGRQKQKIDANGPFGPPKGGNGSSNNSKGKPDSTKHSVYRKENSNRPVGQVVNDLQRAKTKDILIEDNGNIIIRGGNGRVHVLSPDGQRHITTLTRTDRNVQTLIRQGRYNYPTSAKAQQIIDMYK